MTQITPELRQQLLDQGFSAVTYPEQEGEFLIKWVEVRHLQDVFHDSHMEPDMAASIEACPNGILQVYVPDTDSLDTCALGSDGAQRYIKIAARAPSLSAG